MPSSEPRTAHRDGEARLPAAVAVLVAIAHRDAPRLSDVMPAAPRPLVVILGRLMARHPEDRYQDARVVLEDLASYERRGIFGVSEPITVLRPTPAPIDATIALARKPANG